MNTIEMEHAVRFYGTVPAVVDLSLTVPKGSVFGLLGENGSGKTTSIKMMMGALIPQEGTVHDVGDWLDKEGALELPERFRIEVRERPRGREVRFYWLLWEDAGAVGERIRARILEAFPNAGFDDGVDRGRYSARVNRVALPSFLDGGIHWITP